VGLAGCRSEGRHGCHGRSAGRRLHGHLPDGTLQTKEQTLASLRSGATHLTDIKVSDRRVRFYGTTALVTSRADVTGSSAGGPMSGSYRYTRVYVRDKQGTWKVVSFEASRIAERAEEVDA